MRRSVLYEAQVALNATFAQRYDWEMPDSYSDPLNEHAAVRTTVGVMDLSDTGVIKVGGKEAQQFLNGLVTNNVKTLAPGKGMRAAFLTGHGKVRAISRILNLGNEYLILTPSRCHEAIFKYVFPFSYAGDFPVEDVSESYQAVSVQGPKAELLLKEICFEPVPMLGEHDWFRTLVAGHEATVVKASHTGEVGFDLFVAEVALRDVWDFIMLKGRFHSIQPVGLKALETLRVEAGIPEYGIDVDETNMVLELGLSDAVSFDKGCYTGQEAVAMATYRGHISKKLVGILIGGDQVPSRGNSILIDEKEVGIVTSALKSPTLGAVISMAYLKYGFFDLGKVVSISAESNRLDGRIVDLPFYRSQTASSTKETS